MSQNKYEKAYVGLNEKQRQAVDTIYGPVMVIAGPGTGKTQLLSTRVGHILRETDFRPYNILCLTFTNSGVAAMKQRLLDLIGAEGNDVEVYTFHSFAEKILQRYSLYQERENYQFIDEIDQKILIRELLDSVEFNTPLKKSVTGVDASIKFVKNAITQIKKEKYDADALINALRQELKDKRNSDEFIYKRNGKDYKVGDLKMGDWQKFEHKLTKNIQAYELYKKYVEVVRARKLMDFDDMVLNAVRLLEEDENLRLDIQEQYQMVLVDEFQDTSGAQLEIIHQLCRDNDAPNVMVVGDEDQSIYRFQGANLFNIFDFHKRYLAHLSVEDQLQRVVVLEKNYRSTPIILEASRALIEHNSERITHLVEGKMLIKKLQAEHTKLKYGEEPVEIIEVENKEDEFLPIALNIEKLVSSGVALQDIAVLFPTNEMMKEFSEYLQALNYPYSMSKDENILEDRLILSYIQIIRFVLDFAERKVLSPDAFSELLMHPWLGLSLYDISQFWTKMKEQVPVNASSDFLLVLENYPVGSKIADVIASYKECAQMLSLLPPQRYLHYILDCFHIKEWAIRQTNRLEILQKIEVLDQFFKDFLQMQENLTIKDFIQRLDDYEREDIAIPFIRRLVSENSIHLMTYHKSKGLEFDYVFVYKSGRHEERQMENLYVPEAWIDKDLSDELSKHQAVEEKRRLLYVAMTRAKKKLFMTDIFVDGSGKTKNKFKQELNPISEKDLKSTPNIAAPVISKVYHLTENDYIRFEMLNITKLKIKEESLYENEFIQQRLSNFKLSHSSLNSYLECPRKFYMEKIISVPAETSFYMSMGSFYHSVLENFDKLVLDQPEKNLLDELMRIAQTEIYKYRNELTDFEFKDIQQALRTNLPILYEQFISKNLSKNIELEKPLDMQIGSCVLTGKIDKLVFEGDQVTIIDYKTGKLSRSKASRKLQAFNPDVLASDESTVDEKYGGNYWRQAVIYAMLVNANYPQYTIKEVKYVFILPEDNQIQTFTFQPDANEEAYMKNLILSQYQKIQNKDFGFCAQTDCPYCSKVAHRQSLNS